MSAPVEWLTVGARVAAIRNDHTAKSVHFGVVAKIGKRDVVLDDGQRFSVRRLSRDEGGAWGWTVRLVAADDPIVPQVLSQIDRGRQIAAARVACDKFLRSRGADITAYDVILALAPLTGVADQILALDKAAS